MDETSEFIVIPKKRFDNAMLALTGANEPFALLAWLALGEPKPMSFFCKLCGGTIWYQECPTGGWWEHDWTSGHEAECGGYGTNDD